jgi:hypothetical protein
MPLSTILIIILIVLIVAGLPTWPYARGWGYGYYPAGTLGLVLLVVVILILLGKV